MRARSGPGRYATTLALPVVTLGLLAGCDRGSEGDAEAGGELMTLRDTGAGIERVRHDGSLPAAFLEGRDESVPGPSDRGSGGARDAS